MLTIRLNRIGKKNRSSFRIVLQEHTVAPGGRHIEVLGSHDPHQKKTTLKGERIKYWVSKGAQASDSAWNLLAKHGLVEGSKRAVKIPKPVVAEKAAEEPKAEESKAEASPAEGEK